MRTSARVAAEPHQRSATSLRPHHPERTRRVRQRGEDYTGTGNSILPNVRCCVAGRAFLKQENAQPSLPSPLFVMQCAGPLVQSHRSRARVGLPWQPEQALPDPEQADQDGGFLLAVPTHHVGAWIQQDQSKSVEHHMNMCGYSKCGNRFVVCRCVCLYVCD